MTIALWVLSGALLAFGGMCILMTFAVALRYLATGKTGSGFPLAGSIAVLLGALFMPISTIGTRFVYGLIPLIVEVLFALAFSVYERLGAKGD